MKKFDFNEFDKAYNEDIKRRKIEEQNRNKNRKDRSVDRGKVLAFGFIIILAFFIFANMIDGYVEMNRIKFENVELTKRIDTLNEEIADLRIKIQERSSSHIVEKIAREQLGMINPFESQRKKLVLRRSFALNPDGINVIVREDREQKASGE